MSAPPPSGFPGAPDLARPGSPAEREALVEQLVARSAGLVGQAYLERVVTDLGRVLGARYLFVGETVDGGRRARSLALAVDGELAGNFEYDLAGTPCLQVSAGEPCFIEDSAADRYPDDLLLREMGVESYYGFPLCDSRGRTLGLVVALHHRPLAASGWMRTLFQLISARAGAELARMRAEGSRVRSLESSRRYLEALNRLAMNPALPRGEVEALARELVPEVKAAAGFRDVSVWLRDREDEVLVLTAAASDLSSTAPPGTRQRVTLGDVEARGRVRVVEADHPGLPGRVRALLEADGDDGYVEAPVVVAGELRGIVAAVPVGSIHDLAPAVLNFVSDAADLLTRAEMERRRQATERALETARKLEALGALAGGIAHDFNNVLGAIGGNAELLRLETPEDHRELVDEILAGARHGQELIRQIFQFADGEVAESRSVELGGLLQEVIRQIRPLAGDTRVLASVQEAPPPVPGDPVKLCQALVNLCMNAVQALDGAGTVELTARRATHRDVAAHPALLSASCVALEVRDDGPGIPEQLLDTLFQPFVTGRKGRGGTGLGLAIVDRVVRSHGGVVWVDTRWGEGTTVTIVLPAGESGSGTRS